MKSFFTFLFMLLFTILNAQVINKMIYFNSGKSDLNLNDRSWLDSVSSILISSEKYSVIVWAYCDSDGSEKSNMLLAKDRASSINEIFINNKLDHQFIEINVLGENDPVGDNKTMEGKAKNRSAKISVTYQEKQQKKIEDHSYEKNKIDPDQRSYNDLASEKLEVGKTLVLKNLNFEGGSTFLLQESEPTLKALLKLMKTNPTLEIEIGGHVCCLPDMRLSLARARIVYAYLLENGIDKKRMKYKGYGYDKPIASDETEEGRKLNRRVEITIIKL